MKTFEIQSRKEQTREFKIYFVDGKNVHDIIEVVLSKTENAEFSIATWFNPKQTYAEILIMNDEFKEVEFIKITESEKD